MPRAAPSTRDEVRPATSSLARGLEVLRCFTADAPELTVSEIARRSGLPQPTVWRLAQTLVDLGFLVMTPGRQTLRPGLPVLSLGYSAIAGQPIAELAAADMQAIATRHEGAVSLGVRDGASMIYVQRRQGSQIIFADLRVGSRVPIATSATGWAYLAALDEAAREPLLESLAREQGPAWAQIEPRLLEGLRGFASTGYVVNCGSMHARVNSVAVPVVAPDRSIILSLSSGGVADVFTPERLVTVAAELRALAARLSTLLGRHPV